MKYIMDEPLKSFFMSKKPVIKNNIKYDCIYVKCWEKIDRQCICRGVAAGFLIWMIKTVLRILKLCWWWPHFCEYTKYHWHIHVQGVYCMICKLYCNKVVKIDISKQIHYITFRFMSDIPIIPKLLWKWWVLQM